MMERYFGISPKGDLLLIMRLCETLKNRTFLHINSTRSGGGVAEILHRMLPILEEIGVAARWEIIEGDKRFFDITKRDRLGVVDKNCVGIKIYTFSIPFINLKVIIPHILCNLLRPAVKGIMNLFCNIKKSIIPFYNLPPCRNTDFFQNREHPVKYLRHTAARTGGVDMQKCPIFQCFAKSHYKKQISFRRYTEIPLHHFIASISFLTSASRSSDICSLIFSILCIKGSINLIFSESSFFPSSSSNHFEKSSIPPSLRLDS